MVYENHIVIDLYLQGHIMLIWFLFFMIFVIITEEFIGSMIAALAVTIAIAIFSDSPKPSIVERSSQPIYSIGDNYSQVNGHFTLGSGYINSELQYAYFSKNNNGSLSKHHINSDETQIFTGNYQPQLITNTCKVGSSYNIFLGFTANNLSICKKFDKPHYELYLPDGSVIQSFNIK